MKETGEFDSAIGAAGSPSADDWSLLDLLVVLAKHRLLVVGLTAAAAIVAALYSLSIPNIYTATARILPPQQSQSTASSMLSSLGALAGLQTMGGLKNPNDLYVSMLKSRTVADAMIRKFELLKAYGTDQHDKVRTVLAGRTVITSGKDSLITINVEDEDPRRAAELANGYVDELYKLNQSLAVTEASQRRLFFERQLAQARTSLAQAESAARQALDKGGIVQVEGHGRAILETTARLRAQISVKEIQLAAMRTFATEANPELALAQRELEATRRELARLEGSAETRSARDAEASVASGVDSFQLLRNVKYYETMFELLAKQYEMARIDEARDSSLIQVLDSAIPPERKSKPHRSLMVLLVALAGLAVSITAAVVYEAVRNAARDPVRAERIRMLRNYLLGR